MKLRERQFKDKKPEETINLLQDILKDLDIPVEESEVKKSSADTFSLHLTIKGTELGSNGKGISPLYARASAYAELFERMQNRWLQRLELAPADLAFADHNLSWDEKIISPAELATMSNPFLNYLFAQMKILNADNKCKAECLQQLAIFEKEIRQGEDLLCLPFYNIRKNKVDYLPYYLYMPLYGSNGMCAGNTASEALVQGICEILERYVQKQVIKNKIALPELRDDDLILFPDIAEQLSTLNENTNYSFRLYDASLGGRYPVACLAVIKNNSGQYGLKFGSHPDPQLALERCFTEAAQGADLEIYANRSRFNFLNNIVDNEDNISNTFRSGRGQYPYQFFSSNSNKSSFRKLADQTYHSNDMFLSYLINEVIPEQFDILIRDVSITGFPSFQIVIPFMSEMRPARKKRYHDLALKWRLRSLLNLPNLINEKNSAFLRYMLESFRNDDMMNNMRILSSSLWRNSGALPFAQTSCTIDFLIALTFIIEKKYCQAAERLILIDTYAKNISPIEQIYLRALIDYSKGMTALSDHKEVLTYLAIFYDKDVCIKLDELFSVPSQVLAKILSSHRDQESGQFERCDYDFYMDLLRKIDRLASKSDIKQSDLPEKLFIEKLA